jgi:hypothetical protein
MHALPQWQENKFSLWRKTRRTRWLKSQAKSKRGDSIDQGEKLSSAGSFPDVLNDDTCSPHFKSLAGSDSDGWAQTPTSLTTITDLHTTLWDAARVASSTSVSRPVSGALIMRAAPALVQCGGTAQKPVLAEVALAMHAGAGALMQLEGLPAQAELAMGAGVRTGVKRALSDSVNFTDATASV